MNNGFIYPLFDALVRFLCYCNLVEFFKFLGRLSVGYRAEKAGSVLQQGDLISSSNIAIDIYQIFKWFVLWSFWFFEVSNSFSKIFIYYLIFSNLFTYFYYHVWGSRYSQRVDRETLNRKFLNSLLAIAYYLFCYAYLYEIHYRDLIVWPEGVVDFTNSMYLSIANAFTLTYGDFSPKDKDIRFVFVSELVNTFLFFTVIINNSIPNHAGKEAVNELSK